jgi:ElaB/YqjD/DUF883 family membrane-anchored ribosome-binding protein
MDAVKELPEQDSAEMRQDIDATRSAMADKLEALEDKVMDTVQSAKDTVASVKRTFDLKHQIEQRPWTMVGGCFLAGLALGHLLPTGRPQSSRPSVGPQQNGNIAPPRMQAEAPSRAGLLEPFQEEIDKVKGVAIGYVMGLVRDSIKESAPQMGSKFDELMDGITKKLGG